MLNVLLEVVVPGNAHDVAFRNVFPATVQDRTTWMFYARDGNWSSLVSDAVSVIEREQFMGRTQKARGAARRSFLGFGELDATPWGRGWP